MVLWLMLHKNIDIQGVFANPMNTTSFNTTFYFYYVQGLYLYRMLSPQTVYLCCVTALEQHQGHSSHGEMPQNECGNLLHCTMGYLSSLYYT